jgi:phosphoribosylformimino-5-aminoimidazole carboxamide ribotide isomerase
MKIIPAIDILNGKVVRLTEGDYNTSKEYDVTIVEMIEKYIEKGIDFIHIVDLNGAKSDNSNEAFMMQVLANQNIKMEVGGGVRTIEKIKRLLDMGVERVVVGTEAVKNPKFLDEIAANIPLKNMVIATDVLNETIMINGWQESAAIGFYEFMDKCIALGFTSFLCTDISKDGKLEGSSDALYQKMVKKYPGINIIASGGIGAMVDIESVATSGVTEVVVGKAIYENRISIDEIMTWNNKQ